MEIVSEFGPSPAQRLLIWTRLRALGGKGLIAVVEENLMEIPVVMIPNHAPATKLKLLVQYQSVTSLT